MKQPKRFGRYEITTIDPETNLWTHQVGCPAFVKGFAGLREAVRSLARAGYGIDSPSAAIDRVDKAWLNQQKREFETMIELIGYKK